ncbi:MAG: Uncharacterized protein G01um101418_828 [Parcubacteria group bacterium Gr01-1014_18]|nr:MAG: Uncharacterized protein Greene041636_792 [Parcubacteria group bacterium Greene0416_36]TSC80025.1 MAG: Uncharacterized protein G01um101418_828 [Parcubacteria group bacterium Gr01-1014_18]TSC98107.1 MAG: Uncharacterized protein Greene101420_878 [Parcubacteria group bacterium Greene1014_20]TSD06623.1 MAG: Uncharacterized protein Greene07142_762 [Parcubacteria group bacterium Greene0714_2]
MYPPTSVRAYCNTPLHLWGYSLNETMKNIISKSKKAASACVNVCMERMCRPACRRAAGRYVRHYHKDCSWGRFHLIADILGLLVVMGVLVAFLYAYFFYELRSIRELVHFDSKLVSGIVSSGENIEMDIYYGNYSGYPLQNARIQIEADVRWTLVRAAPIDFDADSGTLLLGDLTKGARGTLKLFYKISPDHSSRSLFDSKLIYSVGIGDHLDLYRSTEEQISRLKSFRMELPAPGALKDQAVAPLVPPLAVFAQVLYYDESGSQLGRGPFPPQIGEETRLWLRFRVDKVVRDLQDIRLSFTLPKNSQWQGNLLDVSGTYAWNPRTRKGIFLIPSLLAGESWSGSIELILRPVSSMAGSFLPIARTLSYSAKDVATGIVSEGVMDDVRLEEEILKQQTHP